MKNISVGKKIMINTVIILIFMFSIIVMAYLGFQRIHTAIGSTESRVSQLNTTSEMRLLGIKTVLLAMDIIIDKGSGVGKERLKQFDEYKQRYKKLEDPFIKAMDTDQEKYLAQSVKVDFANIFSELDKLIKDVQINRDKTDGGRYDDVIDGIGDKLEKNNTIIYKSIESELAQAEKHQKAAKDMSSTMIQWIIIIGSIALILGILIGTIIVRSITKVLSQAITNLEENSQQVSSGSQQVSISSQKLAEGASEQASSLEEVSASLEEISAMVQNNSDISVKASSLAANTTQTMDQANDKMSNLRHKIDIITKSSEETSKIIKVIDEIAFQTNLLALNAAVEAARAGEAGLGFAVVADEVRNLARRSAEAAKNTAQLIDNAIKEIKEGNLLTLSTESSFKEVVQTMNELKGLIEEVTNASREQSQGIDQVTTTVSDMDKVTQNTASSAEESAAASEEMSAQAISMMNMVEQLVKVIYGQNGRNGNFKRNKLNLSQTEGLQQRIIPISYERKRNLQGDTTQADVLGRKSFNNKSNYLMVDIDDKDFKNF